MILAHKHLSYEEKRSKKQQCPSKHKLLFITFTSVTNSDLVANSTPIVLLLSRLNSFLVNRDKRLLLPTPESPISTTEIKNSSMKRIQI